MHHHVLEKGHRSSSEQVKAKNTAKVPKEEGSACQSINLAELLLSLDEKVGVSDIETVREKVQN